MAVATPWLANYKASASLAGAAGLHDALSQLVDTSQLDSAWHQRPLLSSADIGGEFLTLETLTAARPNLSQVVYWKATPPHHTASVAEIGMSEALALDGYHPFAEEARTRQLWAAAGAIRLGMGAGEAGMEG